MFKTVPEAFKHWQKFDFKLVAEKFSNIQIEKQTNKTQNKMTT